MEISVSTGMTKPYYRKSEGVEKGTYVRLGRNTVRASPEMIEELRWKSSGLHFENFPCYRSTLNDLDNEEFEKFISQRKNHEPGDFSYRNLESYGLATEEHGHQYPTNAGLLLFGKNLGQFHPEAMIICTHYLGTAGREVVATIDCVGNLFAQFKMAFDFLLSQLPRSFHIEDAKRKETLEIPKLALREALLNAIIHRNYHQLSSTKIVIWADRVEIFSPGGFPGPIDVNDLRAGRSYLRNPSLCKVFREAGYIEKLGSGLIAILDSYQAAHLPNPKLVDGGDYVKYILPSPTADVMRPVTGPLEDRVLVLLEVNPELSIQELLMQLAVPRSSLGRTLSNLIDKKLIERVFNSLPKSILI